MKFDVSLNKEPKTNQTKEILTILFEQLYDFKLRL